MKHMMTSGRTKSVLYFLVTTVIRILDIGGWLETDKTILDKWNNKDLLGLAESKKGLKLEKQFGDRIFIFKIDQNAKIKDQNEIQNPNIQTIQQFSNSTMLPITSWASEFDKYKDGWSRGRYDFWRKHLFTRLRQDFIYTTKNGAVLSHQAGEDLAGELVVRYLDGGTAGSFEIKIQDAKYKIEKNTGEEKFVVKNLGKISVKKDGTVKITNISGENAIADIILK